MAESSRDIEDVYNEYREQAERRYSVYLGECTVGDATNHELKRKSDPDVTSSVSVDEVEERGENLDGWGVLPDLIIEKVFSYLDIPRRYVASRVCRQWQRAFQMPGSWNTFVLQDETLTRHKFNYYMGWQLILDHLRAQMAIFRIGRFVRNLVLAPMTNLFNLYEFMNLLSYYSERYNEDERSRAPLHITSFRFIFRCDLTTTTEHSVYGTGGKLLEGLKRLMSNLNELLNLELIDLMLDSTSEAIHLLDDVCAYLCPTLERLVLINATRSHFPLLHPACFINLRILKISPQNIGTETVELLCSNLYLTELHLIQNKYTEYAIAVDRRAWKNAKFDVFLRTIANTDKELIWQEGAPVKSIIFDSPLTKVDWTGILRVVDLYGNKLEEYGHLGLPRFWRSRKFNDRVDSMLVTICRKCPHLNTLYVRERISTSTLLLIVTLASNLSSLFVRKNALILKCDYKQHNLTLDPEICNWIEQNAKSYDKVEKEVGKLLYQKDWQGLSDAMYKQIAKFKPAY